jgi:hypothetical protein
MPFGCTERLTFPKVFVFVCKLDKDSEVRIRRFHWIAPILCYLGHIFVGTRVRGHDLPAVVKLLKVHRGVPHQLLVGTREIDASPS